MLLETADRIILNQLLPKEADNGRGFFDLKIINDLKSAIGFTEEEVKTMNPKITTTEDGEVLYSYLTVDPIEVPVGERAGKIIGEGLKFINNQINLKTGEPGMLRQQHYNLAKKFLAPILEREEEESKSVVVEPAVELAETPVKKAIKKVKTKK